MPNVLLFLYQLFSTHGGQLSSPKTESIHCDVNSSTRDAHVFYSNIARINDNLKYSLHATRGSPAARSTARPANPNEPCANSKMRLSPVFFWELSESF